MSTSMYVHGVASVDVEVRQNSRDVVCTSYTFRDEDGDIVTEIGVFHPDNVELHSVNK